MTKFMMLIGVFLLSMAGSSQNLVPSLYKESDMRLLPPWRGDINKFKVNHNGLVSDGNKGNKEMQIAYPMALKTNTETTWKFYLEVRYHIVHSTYIRYYLASSDASFSKECYFLEFNDLPLRIHIYKREGELLTKILSAKVSTEHIKHTFVVRVDQSGNWSVITDNTKLLGTKVSPIEFQTNFIGLQVIALASQNRGTYFRDFSITQSDATEPEELTIDPPPLINSITQINQDTLLINTSSVVEAMDGDLLPNYFVLKNNKYQLAFHGIGNDKKKIKLSINPPLQDDSVTLTTTPTLKNYKGISFRDTTVFLRIQPTSPPIPEAPKETTTLPQPFINAIAQKNTDTIFIKTSSVVGEMDGDLLTNYFVLSNNKYQLAFHGIGNDKRKIKLSINPPLQEDSITLTTTPALKNYKGISFRDTTVFLRIPPTSPPIPEAPKELPPKPLPFIIAITQKNTDTIFIKTSSVVDEMDGDLLTDYFVLSNNKYQLAFHGIGNDKRKIKLSINPPLQDDSVTLTTTPALKNYKGISFRDTTVFLRIPAKSTPIPEAPEETTPKPLPFIIAITQKNTDTIYIKTSSVVDEMDGDLLTNYFVLSNNKYQLAFHGIGSDKRKIKLSINPPLQDDSVTLTTTPALKNYKGISFRDTTVFLRIPPTSPPLPEAPKETTLKPLPFINSIAQKNTDTIFIKTSSVVGEMDGDLLTNYFTLSNNRYQLAFHGIGNDKRKIKLSINPPLQDDSITLSTTPALKNYKGISFRDTTVFLRIPPISPPLPEVPKELPPKTLPFINSIAQKNTDTIFIKTSSVVDEMDGDLLTNYFVLSNNKYQLAFHGIGSDKRKIKLSINPPLQDDSITLTTTPALKNYKGISFRDTTVFLRIPIISPPLPETPKELPPKPLPFINAIAQKNTDTIYIKTSSVVGEMDGDLLTNYFTLSNNRYQLAFHGIGNDKRKIKLSINPPLQDDSVTLSTTPALKNYKGLSFRDTTVFLRIPFTSPPLPEAPKELPPKPLPFIIAITQKNTDNIFIKTSSVVDEMDGDLLTNYFVLSNNKYQLAFHGIGNDKRKIKLSINPPLQDDSVTLTTTPELKNYKGISFRDTTVFLRIPIISPPLPEIPIETTPIPKTPEETTSKPLPITITAPTTEVEEITPTIPKEYQALPLDIIFNEIMIDPSPPIQLPELEYIEIYNRSDSGINMNDWILEYGSSPRSIPHSFLAPQSYAILIKKGNKQMFSDTIHCIELETMPTLSNGSGKLKLLNSKKEIIDQLEYSNSLWGNSKKKNGGWSLERNQLLTSDLSSDYWTVASHSNGGTPGYANYMDSLPITSIILIRTGDIIINEILFNPRPNDYDYVELFNVSDQTINLEFLGLASNSKLDTTPLHVVPISDHPLLIAPNEYLSFNATDFKLPALPNKESYVYLVNLLNPKEIIDYVYYNENMHAPFLKNMEGIALERLSTSSPALDGNDWHSASMSSGYGTPGFPNSQKTNTFQSATPHVTIPKNYLTPDGDGLDDRLEIQFNMSEVGWMVSISVYNTRGYPMGFIANNQLITPDEMIPWMGTTSKNKLLPTGLYVIYLKLHHPSGKKEEKKFLVTLQ